jgi:hypothetical protein
MRPLLPEGGGRGEESAALGGLIHASGAAGLRRFDQSRRGPGPGAQERERRASGGPRGGAGRDRRVGSGTRVRRGGAGDGGGASESGSASASQSASAIASSANFDASITEEDKDCQIGKPCEFGSYTSDKTLGSIIVTNAASQDFIPNETGQGFSGAFVVVRFDYTYGGSVPASTDEPTMALEDSDGRLYSHAFEPTNSYGIDTGADLFPYSEIQPGTTQDAVVIFEVDPDASGFTLYAWDPIQPQPSEIARISLNG